MRRPVIVESEDRSETAISYDEDTPEVRWRFKWLERDIKLLKKGHEDLVLTVSGISEAVTKINRNLLIASALIIGLGVGSRLFSSDIVELIKKLAGL